MPLSFYVTIIVVAVVSYFLGSISSGTIVAKRHGIDIKKVGSGNTGTTNAMRTMGFKAGALVFLLDALKGAFPVIAIRIILPIILKPLNLPNAVFAHYLLLGTTISMFAVVAGHIFSIFLNFKGGKGIATSIGAILAFDLVLGIILLTIFGVLVALTKIVSIGSLAAAAAFVPVALALGYRDITVLVIMGLVSVMVIWAHRSNIMKLLRGEEKKFSMDKKKETK